MEGEGLEKKCGKKFPRPFMEETVLSPESYPSYRRRSVDHGGHSFMLRVRDEVVQVDNR
jgi:hypothetical protein